jgi:hypothetical protein
MVVGRRLCEKCTLAVKVEREEKRAERKREKEEQG